MVVVFKCPCCGSEIEGDAELGGGTAQCPGCSETILVPAAGIEEGTELGGYRIERVLGCGGMGEVFLAVQMAMDRKVALKVLPPAMTKSQDSVDRFLHEVRMAAKLEHPNIVTAFDAGEDSGHYYLAMSFVEGEDLYDRLEREGPLPERDALIIALDVAEALAYAWRKHKILHRDIKPANVMIDIVGDVRLMDMGIAKSITEDSNLTMAGMYVGTPFYMSPEQCRADQDLDCRSDIYSLGATLYHLLTGEKPFTASASMAVLAAHLTQPLASPRGLRPELSLATEHLICRMMAKERESRCSNWEELIADIRIVLEAPVLQDLSLPPLPDPLPVGGKGASDATPPTIVQQLAAGGVSDEIALPPADVVPELQSLPDLAPPSDTVPGLKPAVRPDTEAPLPAAPSMEAPKKAEEDDIVESEPLSYRPNPKVWTKALAAIVVIVVLFFAVAGGIFAYNSVGQNRADQARDARDQAARNERDDVAAVEGAIAFQQTRAELAVRTEEQEKQVQGMLTAAAAYEAKNPDDAAGSIEKYEAIVPFAKGTQFQLAVMDHLKRLAGVQENAPQLLMERLKRDGGGLAKRWRFSEAMDICLSYEGPLAEATRAERLALAKEFERLRSDVDRALLVSATGVQAATLLDVAGIQAGIVAVERQARWQQDPYLASVSTGLRSMLNRLRAFSESFQADVGKELSIAVDGRDGQWRIRGVSDFVIRADSGGRTRNLMPANFSARILLTRCKSEDDGYRALKAILAARAGRQDVTTRELSALPDSVYARSLSGACLLRELAGSWQTADIGSRFQLTGFQAQLKIGADESRGATVLIGEELLVLDGRSGIRSRWNVRWSRETEELVVRGPAGNSAAFRRK